MEQAVIEIFVIPALGAVFAAWDIANKHVKARAAQATSSADVQELRSELAALTKRCVDAEKTAHDTKNRLEAAAAAARQHRRGWDAARPVKIG